MISKCEGGFQTLKVIFEKDLNICQPQQSYTEESSLIEFRGAQGIFLPYFSLFYIFAALGYFSSIPFVHSFPDNKEITIFLFYLTLKTEKKVLFSI